MIDDQLTARFEQIAQACWPFGRLERVGFRYLHPRQGAPRGRKRVALPEECLFPREVRAVSFVPFNL
jgi:hypothetical protein